MNWAQMPSPWAILTFIVTVAIAIGAYKTIIAKLVEDVKEYGEGLTELRAWGENEIAKAVHERNVAFLRKDVFDQCLVSINRRLDALDALEISAQLAEIKAMLISLKEQLREK